MIVDGEHYPPVVEAALARLRAAGDEICGVVVAGGKEKLPPGGVARYGGIPARTGDDARSLVDGALHEISPDAVLDLADEPVLDYRKRLELVSVALAHGVPYVGADFRFDPPARPRVATRPSVAVIGTGKRSGKTAVSGRLARAYVATGRRPVVVAMGRGGPQEPQVLVAGAEPLSPSDLLALASKGRHAASDYIEDALLAEVSTVGCFRCGGGLAGGVSFSNVGEGVKRACELDPDLLLVEGSGSAVPPVHADATILVVPAGVPYEYISGYLGAYRLLISDLVVVTMCEDPFGSPHSISSITSHIRTAFRCERTREDPQGELQVVRTVFRPRPTRTVENQKAFVVTTAPEAAGETIRGHLEEVYGCGVVGLSHLLADRERLQLQLDNMPSDTEVLLCEIKAAAVDVATRTAIERGIEVVYMDNELVAINGDDIDASLLRATTLAGARFGSTT